MKQSPRSIISPFAFCMVAGLPFLYSPTLANTAFNIPAVLGSILGNSSNSKIQPLPVGLPSLSKFPKALTTFPS